MFKALDLFIVKCSNLKAINFISLKQLKTIEITMQVRYFILCVAKGQ